MVKKYEQELGQALFGSKFNEYECPRYIISLLQSLANSVERFEWNKTQKQYSAPTENNGGKWSNDTFSIRAYCWSEHIDNDKDCPCCIPNFKCGDFEIRWYKYLGRGTTMNLDISPEEAISLFDKCFKSLGE